MEDIKRKVLIIEDEDAARVSMRGYLRLRGFDVQESETIEESLALFNEHHPDLVLVDYLLPDGNALDFLSRLRAIDDSVPVLILTGHGTIDLAVRAIKEGAEQFLTKPVELPALLVIIERALENRRNRMRQAAARHINRAPSLELFMGSDSVLARISEDAERMLVSNRPILITGETGTGKTLLASWLHSRGPRHEEAFVDLNCAGLSREFLDTELFGHEKGAFTGAVAQKKGLLEIAHRGTLFLDEIGDVDPQVQPKLLKVLEEKKYRRMGDVRDRFVDIQLIAATHRDLAEHVRQSTFRSDLYFRINTLPIHIPPLRERPDDIVTLARHLLSIFATELGRSFEMTGSAERALVNYSWPGNIRELRNVLERAALLNQSGVISARELRFEQVRTPSMTDSADMTLEELEKMHIMRVIRESNGKVDSASQRLGIPRSTLYQKLKVYGIQTERS
ncbi:MAG TPA: sigma-54 dependent transcriptional regulator [Thermoanaerobaculia bacterium]|nr:sigma-54 dependent transcriptional regulator [Thermoanaerobaculia bacterium]